MSDKFDMEINLSNTINNNENNNDNEKNININNSLISSKSLLKELEDKWDKIEKNNTLNSLSLSQKKLSKNTSMNSNNIGNIIKEIVRNKYRNNYLNRKQNDNSFDIFIKQKKEELSKYKKNNSNNNILIKGLNNEISFQKNKGIKQNYNYIQPKLLKFEEKRTLLSPKINKLITNDKNIKNKSLIDENLIKSFDNPSLNEISKTINERLNEINNNKKRNKIKNKSNRIFSVTPIKKSNYKSKINPSSIMPSTLISPQPIKKFEYYKNSNINSMYKIIME